MSCECCNTKITVEKISEYKKAMKAFIKSAAKAKLFLDEKNNLNVTIVKNYDKATNYREVGLVVANNATGVMAVFKAETPTRVYNKVEPVLFESLGEQLAKNKNFGKLIVK